ncbi:asparagine synthase, partial [Vibrio sinaloensis DSM 21326]
MFGIASKNLRISDFQSMINSFEDIYPKQELDSLSASCFAIGTPLRFRRKTNKSSVGCTSVWVDGEAYNLSELNDIFPFINTESFALSLARAYQLNVLEDFLAQVDGYFYAILIDEEAGLVKLISDRYGMRMLYWYTDGAKLIFSPNVLDILSVDDVELELDRESIECFKELGYVLEDNTFLDNIKLIKPASIVTFGIEDSEFSFVRYWKWSQIEKNPIEFEDAVNTLGELFLAAVERRYRVEEKIGVAVSGGLDSRAIVAAISKLHPDREGFGYTFGVQGCEDIKIADQVLKRAGWHHETYYFTQNNWLESRLPYIDVTSGLLDMKHMHGCEFLPDLSKHININLNGYAGDAILGGGFLNKVPWDTRASSENIKRFFGKFTHMIDVEDDYYDIECVEPVIYMNRVRRFTAMGSVCGLHYVEQRKPFFDNRIVEFVFSLPDSYRANNRIYSEMLKRFFPTYFLDIPWQKTGEVVGEIKVKPLYIKVYYRLLRMIIGDGFLHKENREFTDYPNWLRSDSSIAFFSKIFTCEAEIEKRNIKSDCFGSLFLPHVKNLKIDNSNEVLRMAT